MSILKFGKYPKFWKKCKLLFITADTEISRSFWSVRLNILGSVWCMLCVQVYTVYNACMSSPPPPLSKLFFKNVNFRYHLIEGKIFFCVNINGTQHLKVALRFCSKSQNFCFDLVTTKNIGRNFLHDRMTLKYLLIHIKPDSKAGLLCLACSRNNIYFIICQACYIS
jgi:hypothetical protein